MRKTIAVSVTTTCMLFLGVHTATLAKGSNSMPVSAQRQGRQDDRMKKDQEDFRYLLSHRSEIKRSVTQLKNGVETRTESNNPQVAEKIKEHVDAMHARIKEGRGIHLREPLFAAVFRHNSKISMQVEKTEKGVKVKETSDDPFAAKLIQAHADVVSLFVKNGHAEVRKNHAVPDSTGK